MTRFRAFIVGLVALCTSAQLPANGLAANSTPHLQQVVAQAVRPVMQRYGIPGMAVGIVVNGKTYVYDYGVSSRATGRPVGSTTLFEIGSISKTFTATLASYAQLRGSISLSDMAGADFPALRGSAFDRVSLLNLGTHTSGGLPLQVPDDITNNAQLISYLQHWRPSYAPGTTRLYSNVSIGLLGMIVAKRMHADFDSLMEAALFAPLGLNHTFLKIPKAQMANYAQGYTQDDKPIRMAGGVLDSEAYGIRTTAGDMARFLAANMGMLKLDNTVQRALTNTHTGYYRIGAMTQDLIWEQYQYPVTIANLQAGNSPHMLFDPNPAVALSPPVQPHDDTLLNKTGATNGFGAYVAFIPKERIGIVLLANKSYPISARVAAANAILTQLEAH